MKVAIGGLPEGVKNYVAALEGVGLEPVVTLDMAAACACAGLLLPGGGDIDPALFGQKNQGSQGIDRELDEKQLALARRFLADKKPVLGICKGHQILNVALGGTLIQDLATAPAHRYNGQDSVHACVSLEGSLLRRLYGRRYAVNSAHHQGLARLGQGLRVTSYAADGTVESVEHDTLPVLGVQFHPERMCFQKARPDTVDGALLFRWWKEQLG
jgi:putative glutamine amidotransferase